jgi:hypothetical protein
MPSLPHDSTRPLAQFHGGPLDGKTMYLDPFPRVFLAPVIEPPTIAEYTDMPPKPHTPIAEYTNEWMAAHGRPDIYLLRDKR